MATPTEDLPRPAQGENQTDFVARCIVDSDARDAEPRVNERLKLCRSQYRDMRQNSLVTRANAEMDRDPTGTTTVRRDYAVAIRKRLRVIKSAINRGVREADLFGLRSGTMPMRGQQSDQVDRSLSQLRSMMRRAAKARDWDKARELAVAFANTPGRFAFPTDAEKVEAFRGWLQQTVDNGVLEVLRGPDREISQASDFQDLYVRRSYQKGVRDAGSRLRKLGRDIESVEEAEALSRLLNRPIHANKLSSLFTRNFQELQGITDTMAQQVSRELSEGLGQGLNPRKIARNMNDRVEKIGLTRSTTMARTEVVRAHSEATLNRYQESGVEEVAARAEFATAGDSRVCPICQALEAQGVFKLKEARNLIPVHPNCRCTWLPVTRFSEERDVRLPTAVRPPEEVVSEIKGVKAEAQSVRDQIQAEIAQNQERLDELKPRLREMDPLDDRWSPLHREQTDLWDRQRDLSNRLERLRRGENERVLSILARDPENRTGVHLPTKVRKGRDEVLRGRDAAQRIISDRWLDDADIPIRRADTYRASFNDSDGEWGTMYVSQWTDWDSVVHEMGHAVEDNHDEVLAASRQFLDQRRESETTDLLGPLMDSDDYAGEEAFPGDFIDPYVGKFYEDFDASGLTRDKQADLKIDASEVVSMGFDAIVSDPVEFWEEDPEHFRLTWFILNGEIPDEFRPD